MGRVGGRSPPLEMCLCCSNKRDWGASSSVRSNISVSVHLVTDFTFIYKQRCTLFLEVCMKMSCLQETRDQTSQCFYSFRCSFTYIGDIYDELSSDSTLCQSLQSKRFYCFQKNQWSTNSRCFPGQNLPQIWRDVDRVQIPK